MIYICCVGWQQSLEVVQLLRNGLCPVIFAAFNQLKKNLKIKTKINAKLRISRKKEIEQKDRELVKMFLSQITELGCN